MINLKYMRFISFIQKIPITVILSGILVVVVDNLHFRLLGTAFGSQHLDTIMLLKGISISIFLLLNLYYFYTIEEDTDRYRILIGGINILFFILFLIPIIRGVIEYIFSFFHK